MKRIMLLSVILILIACSQPALSPEKIEPKLIIISGDEHIWDTELNTSPRCDWGDCSYTNIGNQGKWAVGKCGEWYNTKFAVDVRSLDYPVESAAIVVWVWRDGGADAIVDASITEPFQTTYDSVKYMDGHYNNCTAPCDVLDYSPSGMCRATYNGCVVTWDSVKASSPGVDYRNDVYDSTYLVARESGYWTEIDITNCVNHALLEGDTICTMILHAINDENTLKDIHSVEGDSACYVKVRVK